jgi:hypothetical protein
MLTARQARTRRAGTVLRNTSMFLTHKPIILRFMISAFSRRHSNGLYRPEALSITEISDCFSRVLSAAGQFDMHVLAVPPPQVPQAHPFAPTSSGNRCPELGQSIIGSFKHQSDLGNQNELQIGQPQPTKIVYFTMAGMD